MEEKAYETMEESGIMAMASDPPKHLGENGARAILKLIKSKAGINYCVCTNGATVENKWVNIPGFELKEGAHVTICFSEGSTANEFTLNINNTGAKPVTAFGGAEITAGRTCEFVYSAGSYIMVTEHNAVQRVWGNLTSSGWYRFASFEANAGSILLQIDRSWWNTGNPRSDILTVSSGYRKAAFTQIGGYGTATGIDKVRYVASNTNGTAYLELHYTHNTKNGVLVSLYPSEVEAGRLKTIDFTPGEVPSGYTSEEFVLSKYNGGMKASVFEGNLLGKATKAEQDSDGNWISGTYEKKPYVLFEGHVKTSYDGNFTLNIPSEYIRPLPYGCGGGSCGGASGNDWFEQAVSSGNYVRVRILGVIDDMYVMFGEVALFSGGIGSFSSDVSSGKIHSDIAASDGEYGIVELRLYGSQLSIRKYAGKFVDLFRVEIF